MRIILNNRPEEIAGYDVITVNQLLKEKNFTFKFLAVRINGKPVIPSEYDETEITEGDQVLVLHLISGG